MPKPESNFLNMSIYPIDVICHSRSTFLKQMRLKQGRGFSIEERRRLIPVVNQQIVGTIQCICRAMQTMSIPFENTQNEVKFLGRSLKKSKLCFMQEKLRLLLGVDNNDVISTLSPRIIDAIQHLWSDKGLQLCYDRRQEYRLTDSAK